MSNPHALIIDDQPSNIDVLAMLLEQEGVSHSSVMRVRDVFPTIDQIDQIDVIFLDMEMPNGDCYTLLDELKAHPRLSETPIVAYTVHVSEIDVAKQAGFDGFLGKPLEMSKFPAQLRQILAGEPVWVY